MSGEKNLSHLLSNVSAILADDIYVFATLSDASIPSGLRPRMIFEEAEGTTVIIKKFEAASFGLAFEFPCRMITLNIHSSLEAVGFIAKIATELAKKNMGVNPVSGFFHDHLFVPVGRETDALRVIDTLQKEAAVQI